MSTKPIGREEFLHRVLARFPQLRGPLEDEIIRGLLHLEMGTFSRLCEDAIDAGQWNDVDACFRLVDEVWAHASPDLDNALYVSFIEHLDFSTPNGRVAFERLPAKLRAAHEELEKHFAALARAAETRDKGGTP
jgi:hypothetical protein